MAYRKLDFVRIWRAGGAERPAAFRPFQVCGLFLYCVALLDVSGTQVVFWLSYLNPGADLSASLEVFIVK
jgi:hypothetical protein